MARKLTDKQATFAKHVAKGVTPTKAARIAGYAYPQQDAYKLMRLPHVRDTLHDRREAALKGDLASLAVDTMRDLMGPDTPAATRYNASKWVLEHAGHQVDPGEGADRDKPLEEMDAEELQRAIQGGMSALQELAGQMGGHHVIDGQVRPLETIENDSQQDADFLQ